MRRYRGRRRRVFGLENLEDRNLLAIDFSNLLAQLDDSPLVSQVLQQAEQQVQQSTAKLPIINKSLSEMASGLSTAISDLGNLLSSAADSADSIDNAFQGRVPTREEVRTALRNALGPILKNGNLTVPQYNWNSGTITVVAHLAKSVTIGSTTFDIGLPALPFKVTGNATVSVTAEFEYNKLSFGFNTGGFFLSAPAGSTASINVGANLEPDITQGILGFLAIDVKPIQKGVSLSTGLTFDANGIQLSNPRLTGEAEVNLRLTAATKIGTLDGFTLPNVQTDLHIDWPLAGDHRAGADSLGQSPTVEFRDVKFGMGTFLSRIMAPLVSNLKQATAPAADVTSILDMEIPGISDLTKLNGAGSFTVRDLIQLTADAGQLPPDWQFITDMTLAATQVQQLIANSTIANKQLMLNAGNFGFGGADLRKIAAADLNSLLDFRKVAISHLVPIATTAVESLEDRILGDDPLLELPAEAREPLKRVFRDFKNRIRMLQNNASYSFPILEDPEENLFKFLLGRDVDFVKLDADYVLPVRHTEFFPFWGPINVRFNWDLELDAHFHAGYDTRGLRRFADGLLKGSPNPAVLADGFYFDTSKPILQIDGRISLGVTAIRVPYLVAHVPIPPFVVPIFAIGSFTGDLVANDEFGNPFQFRFADPKLEGDHVLRPFSDGATALFEVSADVFGEFNFVAETGPEPIGPFFEVFRYNIERTPLFGVESIDRSNPYNRPPPPSDIPLDLSVDLNYLTDAGANDGQPDTVVIQRVGSQVYVYVNGRRVTKAPLSRVRSVEVVGSGDDERFIVHGRSLVMPIKVDGRRGNNTLLFNDESWNGGGGDTRYELDRGVLDRNRGELTITYNNFDDVGLRTAQTSNSVFVKGVFVTTEIVGGRRANAYFLGLAASLRDFRKDLTIVGGASNDFIRLFDSIASVPVSYAIDSQTIPFGDTWGTVQRRERPSFSVNDQFFSYDADGFTLRHQGIESLEINGGRHGNSFSVDTGRNLGALGALSLSLRTGGGDDRVSVISTNERLWIDGSGGFDQVEVGNSARGTDLIASDIDVRNTGGYTALSVNDTGSTVDKRIQLLTDPAAGHIYGLTPVLADRTTGIHFVVSELEALAIRSGSGNDQVLVADTPYNLVRDTRNEQFPVSYELLTQISLGAGNDQVWVPRTTGGLHIAGEAGTNQIHLGVTPGFENLANLNNLLGTVGVDGIGGATNLFLSDVGAFFGYDYGVESDRLIRRNAAQLVSVAYANLRQLHLAGGYGNDRFTINDTPLGASIFLSGGWGVEQATILGSTGELFVDLGDGIGQSVQVGDTTHSLADLKAPVKVTANSPLVATVINEAESRVHVPTFESNALGGMTVGSSVLDGQTYVPQPEIEFGPLSSLYFQTGFEPGTVGSIGVNGTSAGTHLTINGIPGAMDVMKVQPFGNQRILGPVTFVGQRSDVDFAYYTEVQNPGANTYTVSADPLSPTATRVERTGAAPVVMDGIVQVLMYLPDSGGSTVNVVSAPQAALVIGVGDESAVNIGTSAPQLGGSLAGIKAPISVAPWSVDDDVRVVVDDSGNQDTTPKQHRFAELPNQTTDYVYSANLFGNRLGFSVRDYPRTSVVIRGGAADETYSIEPTIDAARFSIDGGGGRNTLDYSQWTTGVAVNLPLGTASGLFGGIANIHDVIGGSGNDLLVGNGGNVLRGGAGRDFLIAGATPGVLYGGNDDDVLVGGTTAYDLDATTLDSIFAEWSESTLEFDARVAEFRQLLSDENIISNGQVDDLFGEAGENLVL
jgi:hypothetical protein